MTAARPDFFTKEMAQGYDERNRKLAPISESLHFLMALVLENAPSKSKVLSVGAGTGAEIEPLIGQSGVGLPIKFFQAFMIVAWYAIKGSDCNNSASSINN